VSSKENHDDKDEDWIVLRLDFSRYTTIEENGSVDVMVPREIGEFVGVDTGWGHDLSTILEKWHCIEWWQVDQSHIRTDLKTITPIGESDQAYRCRPDKHGNLCFQFGETYGSP
jgi:hypothetical protein